jgi:hypothetical protein
MNSVNVFSENVVQVHVWTTSDVRTETANRWMCLVPMCVDQVSSELIFWEDSRAVFAVCNAVVLLVDMLLAGQWILEDEVTN